MAARKSRLEEMAAAPAEAAPDLLGAEDGPQIEHRPPLLADPCPVIPLGVLGTNLVFLDRHQQIHITSPECQKGVLKVWFGNNYLLEHYEQLGKGKKPTGKFDQDDVQTALIEDCCAKGIFNPAGKVLGRGAHRPKADESVLAMHMGRSVMISHADGRVVRERAGMVKIAGKDVFFPAADALDPPADKPAGKAEGEEVLALFERWNWVEPAAPLLLLGWLGQAYVCGAMEWRAHAWLPGPTASGKSSLQKRIRALLGSWCLSTADASEAAIRQILGNDTLAVSIDEAEAHDNPERLQAVLNLMKKASSGDKIHRGGADHKGTEFTAQSCFLLSSVIHAPLRGEDRNRIALLELRKLPENVEPLEMELAKWASTGRRLHRRMIAQWPRFERTLAAYKRRIGEMGFEGRWGDTFGTLLACADLLRFDYAMDDPRQDALEEPDESRVFDAVAQIMPLLARGRVEARTDTERVILHLNTHMLQGASGRPPEPVGLWIERAMELTEGQFETSPQEVDAAARNKLKAHGLRVVQVTERADGKEGIADALTGKLGWEGGYLAVAYGSNKAVTEIFARSDWAGGGWTQSLKKIEGARGPIKVRFAGSLDNAMLVPLAAFKGGDEG